MFSMRCIVTSPRLMTYESFSVNFTTAPASATARFLSTTPSGVLPSNLVEMSTPRSDLAVQLPRFSDSGSSFHSMPHSASVPTSCGTPLWTL